MKSVRVGTTIYEDDGNGSLVAIGEASLNGQGRPTVAASEVEPRNVEWLWPGFVPAALLTLLAGPTTSGKSTITYELAARLSREGRSTVLVNAEDAHAFTIRPRLEAAGAALELVRLWTLDEGFTLPEDVDKLRDELDVSEAALLVLDFRKADDGLAHPWAGRVYLNPPYGRAIPVWVRKLVDEHRWGNVPEAIALVASRPDTEWFALVADFPRCEIKGRLTFANAVNPAPFPSVVFYLGPNEARFAQVFSALGRIVKPVASAAQEDRSGPAVEPCETCGRQMGHAHGCPSFGGAA